MENIKVVGRDACPYGGSLQGYTIYLTQSQISKRLGYHPCYFDRIDDEKVTHEWYLLEVDDQDNILDFARIYDWKTGYSLEENDEYLWHIGGTSTHAIQLIYTALNMYELYEKTHICSLCKKDVKDWKRTTRADVAVSSYSLDEYDSVYLNIGDHTKRRVISVTNSKGEKMHLPVPDFLIYCSDLCEEMYKLDPVKSIAI